MKTRHRALFALASCILPLSAPSVATAAPVPPAPVTVDLRIEGPTTTLYEGKVTTGVRDFRYTGDATTNRCDATAANGGTSPIPAITAGAAVAAAIDAGLPVAGRWFDGFGPSFTQIAGTSVDWDAATSRYLVEYVDGKGLSSGICATPVADGDEVLLAYAEFGQNALRLTVPARVAPGATATATVTDAATGAPVAGASVFGKVTGADGTAQIGPFPAIGDQPALKAAKTGYVRSNAGRICVTNGADGACNTVLPATIAVCEHHFNDGRCGTTDVTPPTVLLQGIKHNARFARSDAPRELTGVVGNFPRGADGPRIADPSGIKDVRLRITRYAGKNCWYLNATSERFVKLKKCDRGAGRWFSAGDKAEWSYQLPGRLARGKYRIESAAIDSKGNVRRAQVSTVNHIVFRVR